MVIGADITSALAVGSEDRYGLISILALPSTRDPDRNKLGGIVIEVFAVLNVVKDRYSTVPMIGDVVRLMIATL